LLSTVVTACDLVDVDDLNEAYLHMVIGEDDEHVQQLAGQILRKPICVLKPEWHTQQGVNIAYKANEMGLILRVKNYRWQICTY